MGRSDLIDQFMICCKRSLSLVSLKTWTMIAKAKGHVSMPLGLARMAAPKQIPTHQGDHDLSVANTANAKKVTVTI